MKVGDYVRTKDGIKRIKEEDIYDINLDTIKSSPNIIDLIDYHDIIKYRFNGEDFISEVFEYKNDKFVMNENNLFDISKINIKSILTHEQFDAMKYEVK